MTNTSRTNPVGFTTTIPVEVVLAAGCRPVDLNNCFINDPDPGGLIREAEELGLSRTLCAWIKGIYAWALAHPEVETIVAVTQGDCSNTQALMELLTIAGRRVVPFDFPHGRDAQILEAQIGRLAKRLGADVSRAEEVRRELAPLRTKLALLDQMTWQEGRVAGHENHLWLLGSSDFEGDPQDYHQRLGAFLDQARNRPRSEAQVRLGLLGVPPIMDDLHQTLAELGAAVVYNEVPRQFAMLPGEDGGPHSLVEQYQRYTYPYDVFGRIPDIKRELKRRRLHGLVHYTQSFCFRQIQDLVLRERLRVPMLTLEGDRAGPLDARTRMRLEAFIDVLR
ncbi:MAG: 2-hydroxyacyl-CoA dehydratase [Desulfarculaceae bacterium]|jgi:benzoyl-CoA reductase/2-hydroxyglutaryl-CoA dehydratase subunit BcrC/BadD/HgdB